MLTEGIVHDDGSIEWLTEAAHTSPASKAWMDHLVNARGGEFDQNDRYIFPGTVDDQVWSLQWFEA
ncbi:hypothetical protein A5630_25465 [Mycolicibacterium mucogenicum]|uniref:Uncharacterized protein n=1 Tax=Mycolicibacterium mucogenicum TaxID=56689 RepID=A0A1A3GY52_MYCMU|nr:hypothetical protein A5630_25465 [Mycolicibacterium mucogenicum]